MTSISFSKSWKSPFISIIYSSWRVLIVNGNYRVEIYIYLLDLTRNSCEKFIYRSLAGIELAALWFWYWWYSALTNWATDTSCQALTTSSCIYCIYMNYVLVMGKYQDFVGIALDWITVEGSSRWKSCITIIYSLLLKNYSTFVTATGQWQYCIEKCCIQVERKVIYSV